MCGAQCVVALLALAVGLAHCFSWDVAVSRDNCLDFYENGNLTHSEDIPSAYIPIITNDPIHHRVLFIDQRNETTGLHSFDTETMEVKTLAFRDPFQYMNNIAYDPVTDIFFWADGRDIYTLSLKPGSKEKGFGTRLIKMEHPWTRDVVVDSCRGYIYWIAQKTAIYRARLNGTEREMLVDDKINWLYGLAIDQQTQKMYWIGNDLKSDMYTLSIECSDLDGKNIKTLYQTKEEWLFTMLSVSKDSIYWGSWPSNAFRQIPKNPPPDVEPIEISNRHYMDITANYKIEDQIEGIQDCEALKGLLPSNFSVIPLNVTEDAGLLCVHGTQVSGESVCECAQGYSGERCEVSVCQNYCVRGDCSVSAEGLPTCSCNASYSGKRCEVNLCQGYCLNNGVCSLNTTNEPICQCSGGYEGDRCDVSVCQNYCFQGDCSVSADGKPKCSCNIGYSGERCEDKDCQRYCLNNGLCSMNEEGKPVCRCTEDYEGDRCDVPVYLIKCFRTMSMFKDILNTDVTRVALDKGLNPTCASTVV